MKRKFDIQLPALAPEKVFSSLSQIDDWNYQYVGTKKYTNKIDNKAIVFVLDTAGVFDHPDLVANSYPRYDKNFSSSNVSDDLQGHGTHCAGIVAASNNEFGTIGINSDTIVVAIKVLNDFGSGSMSDVAEGIRYVADLQLDEAHKGFKKIISMSLGSSSASPKVESALKYAKSKGVISFAAAGNAGKGEKDTVAYPAKYDGLCISVASLDKGDKSASYSSQGDSVDISTGGSRIYSTYKNKSYARLSGTSMATPAVAGLAALIVSYFPEVTWNQMSMETFLKDNAKDLGTKGIDPIFGAGSILADNYLKEAPKNDFKPLPQNRYSPFDPAVGIKTVNIIFDVEASIMSREIAVKEGNFKLPFEDFRGRKVAISIDCVIDVSRNVNYSLDVIRNLSQAYANLASGIYIGELDSKMLSDFEDSDYTVHICDGYASFVDIAYKIADILKMNKAIKILGLSFDFGEFVINI